MSGLYGIVQYALFPASCNGEWDPTESLETIVRDGGFGAVEITWIKDGATRKKVARILGDSGMQIGRAHV